jgi:hypothetical protein
MSGNFFEVMLKQGENLVGIVSLDIVRHSSIRGGGQEIANTKSNLLSMFESELPKAYAGMLPRQGDGVAAIFDISDGCNRMVLFADRIRHLIPYFNRTRDVLNELPGHQDVGVRIVCHAGEVLNNSLPGDLSGEALNTILKYEKEIGRMGYVTLSFDVYRRLTDSLKIRCLPGHSHKILGQIYLLDGDLSYIQMSLNDHESKELKEWITNSLRQQKYTKLYYFAYTNERLYDFLGYQLSGVDVRILARNWVVEREEEQAKNQLLFQKVGTGDSQNIPKPWLKSDLIKTRAKELMENIQVLGNSLDIRFYSGPPIFKGAILADEDGNRVANIGLMKWIEQPPEGGSPYKLYEWPSIILNSNHPIQEKFLEFFESRFFENWKYGTTYEQVLRQDEKYLEKDPTNVGQIWVLDGKPYLIIYPNRIVPNRPYPLVAHEDATAFRAIENFLKNYGVNSQLFDILLPKELQGKRISDDVLEKIENWDGHVIYICSKSIFPQLKKYLRSIDFPYEFRRLGSARPAIFHRPTQTEWVSPTDSSPPAPKDYSLIARFPRPDSNGYSYIIAGIHSIGTWGAARYLTDTNNINAFAQLIRGKNFAAMLETRFDQRTREIDAPRLFIAPDLIEDDT